MKRIIDKLIKSHFESKQSKCNHDMKIVAISNTEDLKIETVKICKKCYFYQK